MDEPTAQATPGKKPKFSLSLFAVLFMVALGSWWIFGAPRPRFFLTACLQDASGLRQGARVRIAGVDVGFVKTVRAQPQDRACPALIEMAFTVNYKLQIPRDSMVSTPTAGVLGETYLQINTRQASGPQAENGSRLPSVPVPDFGGKLPQQRIRSSQEAGK